MCRPRQNRIPLSASPLNRVITPSRARLSSGVGVAQRTRLRRVISESSAAAGDQVVAAEDCNL